MVHRRLYLHIGTAKSGTSSLQGALWNSTDELARAGVGLPFAARGPAVRRVLVPLGWAVAEGFTRPIDHRGLQRLARRLRQTAGDVLLISNEDLAEAGPEHIAALYDTLASADIEPRIIVTARDWSKQLPSDYQQLLKHNITDTYDAFLRQVQDRVGVGEQFWRRQDLPDICGRWGAGLPPEHVHVLPVPAYRVDPSAVYREFAHVVGFDHHDLNMPAKDTNASFGMVEAELLRRFNTSLDGRLSNYTEEYQPAVRNTLIRYCIARGASARLTLPPEHVGWVHEMSQDRAALLAGSGYTVHGDLSSLIVPPDSGAPMPAVTDDQIAEAAVATLARFAVRTFDQRARAAAE